MGHSNPNARPADGSTWHYWIGSDGTRSGAEVIVPVQLRDPDNFEPEIGINISNIYTWIRYPSGRIGPPGGVVTECDITITPPPDGSNPIVWFEFILETLQR